MTKELSFLTTFALLIISPSDTIVANFGQPDSSIFPLHLGSEWTFSDGTHQHTEKITDTATIRGKLYYGLTMWAPYFGYWMRASNDSVFVMQSANDSSEVLIYHFTAHVGDTIYIPLSYACLFGVAIVLASKDETVPTPADTFAHCYHFRHIPYCPDAGMLDSWIAKGVGRIKYSEESIVGPRFYDLASYNLITSVSEAIPNTDADSYLLLDPYPNPFNPQTTLTFHLAKASYLSLRVLDLLGREVAKLVNGHRQAGEYQVVWNASQLPTGVYFAVLHGGGRFSVKKIVLQE